LSGISLAYPKTILDTWALKPKDDKALNTYTSIYFPVKKQKCDSLKAKREYGTAESNP
jgi:hypothetical protein